MIEFKVKVFKILKYLKVNKLKHGSNYGIMEVMHRYWQWKKYLFKC